MIVILFSWLNTFFLSYVWGKAFISFFVERWFKTNLKSIILPNFIGLATLNWITDTFAIFIPINYKFQIGFQIFTIIIFFILLRKKKVSFQVQIFSKKNIFPLIIFIYIFLATWLKCFFPTGHYDEGLYYIQHIRWIQNYGFVNGLANLHTRFGFNSNWHNLSSLFEYSFLTENYFHNDLNGFLFIIFAITGIKSLYFVLQKKPKISSYLLVFYVLVLMFPESNFFTFGSSYVNTISPDWASYIFVSITFVLLAESLENNKQEKGISIFVASLLAFYCFSIKISNLPILSISFFSFVMMIKNKAKLKDFFLLVASFVLWITPWIVSNVILSGYILFPVQFTELSFIDWTVPKTFCQDIIKSIKNFAYTGESSDISFVSNNFYSLFSFWIKRQPDFIKYFYLSFIFLWIFEFVVFILMFLKKTFTNFNPLIFIYSICSLGTIFWFFNAPDYRFSFVYLSSIFVIGATLLAQYVKINSKFLRYLVTIVILALFKLEITLNDIKNAFSTTLPSTNIVNYEIKDGINVTLPSEDQCYDTPIPCTPHSEYIKGKILLDTSNIRKGFKVK